MDAEKARVEAETNREATLAKTKADCETATKAANDAASEATLAKTKADCESATKAATDAASEATLAKTKAETATDGAEKVDASLDGNVLTVTNRKGEEKSVNLTDSDEHVSVTLTTSVSGVSVANTQLNVYLNHATIGQHYITDVNGQVDFTVPKGSEYRIVFPDKEGCSAITPVQHIAAVGSRIIEVEYKAYVEDVEHVTVECVSHDDSGAKSGIEGKIVTVKIGNATSTYTTDGEGKATFDVAIGKSYTVSVTEIDGMYEYHSRVSVSRTAEDEHYHILFSFYTYESGLWVITDDGKQYTDEEFEASGLDGSTIRLVKIASKNLSQGNGIFCIDLEGIKLNKFPSKQWCPSNVLFNNIPTNGRDTAEANYWEFVYNGLHATETIIAEGDERSLETPAADYCYSQSVEVNGVKHQGYLPTCDQWVEAWNNREFVNWALETKYPGQSVRFSAITSNKWSSTQANATNAWFFGSSPNSYGNKSYSVLAVPFYAC